MQGLNTGHASVGQKHSLTTVSGLSGRKDWIKGYINAVHWNISHNHMISRCFMGAIFHYFKKGTFHEEYFKKPINSCLLARGNTREDIISGYKLMTGGMTFDRCGTYW